MHRAKGPTRRRVECPMGASGLLEAEVGTSLLVDISQACNAVPRVLHLLLDDTTWEGSRRFFSPENPDPSVA